MFGIWFGTRASEIQILSPRPSGVETSLEPLRVQTLDESCGGASLIDVLRSGDPLFGSTVTALSVGRFALNDHLQLVFEYELADGRSGIAVALLEGDHRV